MRARPPARVVHILIPSGNKSGFRVETASVPFAILASIRCNFIRPLIGSRDFNKSTESNMPASRYSMTLCVHSSIRGSPWHTIAQIRHRNLKWSGKSSQIKAMVIYRAHLKQTQWTGLLYKLYKYMKQNYWHQNQQKHHQIKPGFKTSSSSRRRKWVFSVVIKRLEALIWKCWLLHGFCPCAMLVSNFHRPPPRNLGFRAIFKTPDIGPVHQVAWYEQIYTHQYNITPQMF